MATFYSLDNNNDNPKNSSDIWSTDFEVKITLNY